MVHMEPEAAYDALQRQAFTLKLLEIGKVLMSWSILKRPDQVFAIRPVFLCLVFNPFNSSNNNIL